LDVSIIRVGLAETKKFAEGYEAIFGKVKKDGATADQSEPAPAAPTAMAQPAAAKAKKKPKRK
jgi:hypothetical protein